MSNKKSQTKWCLSKYPKTGKTMAPEILWCQSRISQNRKYNGNWNSALSNWYFLSTAEKKKQIFIVLISNYYFLGWWYMEVVKYVIVAADLFIIYSIFCLLKSLKFLNISFWSIKSALGQILKVQNCNVVINLRIWNSEYFI